MASDSGIEKAGSETFVGRQRELFRKGFSFSGYERDMVCLNLGAGRYLDVSGVSGLDAVTDGRGAVFGDFDDDGDPDVFLASIQGPARLLFRNEVGSRTGWLRLSLEGKESGREAIGATVRVRTSAGTLTKVVACGSGYLSQSDRRLLFGLGSDASCAFVEVAWPSGLRQRFGSFPARTSWRLLEGEASPRRVEEKPFSLPDPLPPGDPALAGVRIRAGERFPALPALSLDGSRTTVAPSGTAKRTLVHLWATWCANCRREMPALALLREEVGAGRLEVVGLSVDDPREVERVRAFLEERRIGYPNLVAEADAIRAVFGGERVSVPVSFLLDSEGRVLDAFVGWSPRDEARLRAAVGAP